MLTVQVAIVVSDPDGTPAEGGTGVLIQESAQIGCYPANGLSGVTDPADMQVKLKQMSEDVGVAIATASKEVTDRALAASATLAKDATDMGGQ